MFHKIATDCCIENNNTPIRTLRSVLNTTLFYCRLDKYVGMMSERERLGREKKANSDVPNGTSNDGPDNNNTHKQRKKAKKDNSDAINMTSTCLNICH